MRKLFLSISLSVVIAMPVIAQTVDDLQQMAARKMSATFASPPALSTTTGGTPTNADFFSRFIMALETLAAGQGDAVTFDWNFPTDFSPTHAGKFQVVLRKPDLGAHLVEHLGTSDTAIEALRGELSYSDDVTYTISIAPRAKTMAVTMAAAVQQIAPTLLATSTPATTGTSSPSITSTVVSAGSARAALMMFEPLAEKAALMAASQSKLHVDASYRVRRDLAGPNEFILKATYELGADPVAEMEKELDAGCRAAFALFRDAPTDAARQTVLFGASGSSACAADVLDAVATAAETPRIDRQLRYAFTIDAHWTEGQDIHRTTPVVIDLPGKSGRSIAIAAAIGWDVYRPEEIDKRGRLELSATYDTVTGDPNRDDRFIGKLTYSQRISDGTYAPISLVYASKADYLTNVDRRLNAHFGIAFKIPPTN